MPNPCESFPYRRAANDLKPNSDAIGVGQQLPKVSFCSGLVPSADTTLIVRCKNLPNFAKTQPSEGEISHSEHAKLRPLRKGESDWTQYAGGGTA